jgi:hypothetical protein
MFDIVKGTTEAITEAAKAAQTGFALPDSFDTSPVAAAAADLVGVLLGALFVLTGAILHCSQAVAAGPKSDECAVRSASTAGNKLKIVLADERVVVVPPADYQCSFD